MRALLLVAIVAALAACGSGNGAREASDPNVIEGADIERRDLRRIETMLRGQVAGVSVEQRGGSWVIRIRGAETFGVSNADPLFVVDGVTLPLGLDDPLVGLNPRDVASIRVLKNASETAMYGAQGANGVIVITTHRTMPPVEDDAGP